ncbi:MAG: hypothetical protein IT211_08945 [Armatimonadetes bacterium]|nr:hypothetical protein [Armatimonadota bacterium]
MTTQELLIGYFEGGLTPEESLHLETMLSGSAELRAQFNQHQQIHSMMQREAEETKPSETLDEATIGAALGLLGQTVGGASIAFWSGTKIAATIGTVVVGGAVTWFAVTQNPEPPQAPSATTTQPAPTIQTAPVPQLPDPAVAPVTEQASSSGSTKQTAPASSSKESNTFRSKGEKGGSEAGDHRGFNLEGETPVPIDQEIKFKPNR